MPRRAKGKRVYGTVILLLVLGGGYLQFQWMDKAHKPDVVPNVLAEKVGRWMMQKRGISPHDETLTSSVAATERVPCETCMGSGKALASGGKEICPICLGVGFHTIRRFDSTDRICPYCAGMGRAAMPDTGEVGSCPRCQGRGLVQTQRDAPPTEE